MPFEITNEYANLGGLGCATQDEYWREDDCLRHVRKHPVRPGNGTRFGATPRIPILVNHPAGLSWPRRIAIPKPICDVPSGGSKGHNHPQRASKASTRATFQ